MHAAILSIGDELTLGQTADTNSVWLAAQLMRHGWITVEHRTVADDRPAIAGAIEQLASRVNLLIITGGLGPTDDDLTREALADAFSSSGSERGKLVVDDEAMKQIEGWFTRQGRPMPALNRRQAMRPAAMRMLTNANGTAPGLAGDLGDCMVFSLPGPPREMQPMFEAYIVQHLRSGDGAPAVLTGIVESFGIGESSAAERLGELMRRDRNPLVGTTVSGSIVAARVRSTAGSQGAAEAAVTETLEQIERHWHPYAYSRGERSLATVVGELLKRRGLALATAESCSGGMLGSMIVDVPGSSDWYLGGWITYSNDMKASQIGVSESLLREHGAVSQEAAAAMARGAMRQAGSDVALAITGIAGPDGGSDRKPVGTVFIALAFDEHVIARRFLFTGDRWTVRDRSAKSALQMLRFHLLEVDPRTPMLWSQDARGAFADMTTDAYIALGSNIGAREAHVREALERLGRLGRVVATSDLIETQPVGEIPQGAYLNAAARLATSLQPRDLLNAMLEIEREGGRDRTSSTRWGPRTIDLDLLLYGDWIIDEPGLTVPHPRLHERLFVLQPLAQIAAEVLHPILGSTIGDLLAELRRTAAGRAASGSPTYDEPRSR
jgi:nicotinamide-nucleotide amidase